jgi:hypothetical protein
MLTAPTIALASADRVQTAACGGIIPAMTSALLAYATYIPHTTRMIHQHIAPIARAVVTGILEERYQIAAVTTATRI